MRFAGRVLWIVGCLGLAGPMAQAGSIAVPSSDAVRAIEAQYPGYGREWDGRREHCLRLRERLREVRYRMDTGPYWERGRLEGRFGEIREKLRNECRGHWRED